MVEVMTPQGMEEMELNLKEHASRTCCPKKTKKTRVPVPEALEILTPGGGEPPRSTWRP